MDAHSYLSIHKYPDREVHPVCMSLDGPWMPIVTWASMDTLTEGCTLCVYVPGWSMDDAHSRDENNSRPPAKIRP